MSREILRALLELQELDAQILRLREELRRRPEALRRQETSAAEAHRELEELRHHVRDLQKLVDLKGVELKAAEEAVRKLEAQSQTLKTNEEYAAMQKQIAGRRSEIGALEDRMLEAMEVVDQARTGIPEREASLGERERALTESKQRTEEESGQMERRLMELAEEWERRSSTVPAEALSLYRSLRDRWKGTGMAELGPDRICQGCHMSVTAHHLNQAMAGLLVQCGSCQRILWLP